MEWDIFPTKNFPRISIVSYLNFSRRGRDEHVCQTNRGGGSRGRGSWGLGSKMKPANTPQLSAVQRLSRFLHLDIPEVWVRFLLALVGLILAFAARLFWTV